jgi:hypothetical protein
MSLTVRFVIGAWAVLLAWGMEGHVASPLRAALLAG